MGDTRHTRLLIIGSGPAGYTASVYGSRAMLNPILIQGMEPGGQLTITTEVENWPGDIEVQGPDLMQRMQAHAEAVGTEVIADTITELDLSHRPFTAKADSGTTFTADAVILATGAQAKWLGLPTEEKFKGFGVSACATCDGFFYRGKEVVVIGGGNTAVEEALFLTNFATKVTLIHRRDELRAEKILQHRLENHPKVEIAWNKIPVEILGTEEPLGVTGVRVQDVKTGAETTIPCDGFFVAIGHAPCLVAGERPARPAPRRLRQGRARHHPHLDPRRLRRGRSDRPRLPPGRHLGRHGLHGRARRRALAGRARGLRDRAGTSRAGRFPHHRRW